ncbi:hypothetical protein CHS0354_043129 [Potamilus streckersoni]|uniref:Uncharacterized protein n=1 Tax=Potamilus streckersoni TaxID=2493646 RepID=A0AAE0VTZ9_9BIVA|nr:hypothetical protein CHS0354_043129 [Potamilus streckersoni]
MASSRPNYEEELRKVVETLINFNAFTQKAKLDPEKYPNLEQSMHTYISIITEITHKARDGQNNCREYLIACHPSLLRANPGRVPKKDPENLLLTLHDKNEHNSSPTDSGISSGIIAEETGGVEEKEDV